jgi:FAD/FMN-containing dehydrogenase
MMLSGWGRYPRLDCALTRAENEEQLRALLAQTPLIARGNGRAYGDSALNPHNTVDMRRLNRMLAFDPNTGQLVAEAGVLLADVIATFLPRGWFPAVTPGTKYVTLGGMAAADVHGKNHHCDGSFGAWIDWLDLMDADGAIRRCSPDEEPELFEWTIGGMGLTGVILRIALRLRRVETGWIRQHAIIAPDLGAAVRAFAEHGAASYSVAWVDCLSTGRAMGRSIVMLGEHARRDELPAKLRGYPLTPRRKSSRAVPFDLPGWLLNGATMRAFNSVYYFAGRRGPRHRLVDYDSYFYPLDSILNWNRIYGRRGFTQFQSVVPLAGAEQALREMLEATSKASQGSFLSVLKRFGPGRGGLSFPMEGYTLALDFPMNGTTLALMQRLDAITLAHGGRFYLAKDSRLSAETLRRSDTRLDGFRAMRQDHGLFGVFTSAQAERLGL